MKILTGLGRNSLKSLEFIHEDNKWRLCIEEMSDELVFNEDEIQILHSQLAAFIKEMLYG